MMPRLLAAALLLLAGLARADDPDAAALALPGSNPEPAAQNASNWQWFVEAAAGPSVRRDSSLQERKRAFQRLSFDVHADLTLSAGLRAVFSDRLDLDWRQGEARKDLNTIKEAYLSWQPRADLLFDAGRINQYSGVGVGYNPTDFFRDRALRSQISVDPTVIKKNRQGSVMLRGQMLWDGASLSVLYAPGLREQRSSATFNPDLGATNQRDRALLVFSKRISEELNPQWLLYKDQGAAPQLGMNLTRLLNDSSVAYFEWAGGRSRTQLAQALGQPEKEVFRNRIATGLTYTTADKLSISLEYQYNGSALTRAQWDALPRASLPAYIQYRLFAEAAQELPTKNAFFVYVSKPDFLLNHLNLSLMVRRNSEDHSRLSWLELRYLWQRDELALQWQGSSGNLVSDYGAAELRRAWQLSYRHFF